MAHRPSFLPFFLRTLTFVFLMALLSVAFFAIDWRCDKGFQSKRPNLADSLQHPKAIKKSPFLIQHYSWSFEDPRDGQSYEVLHYDGQDWWIDNCRYAVEGARAPFGEKDSVAHYGWLYTWEQVMQGDTATAGQGICPAGWHVPSWAEWQAFAEKLGTPLGYIDYQYSAQDSFYQQLATIGFWNEKSWAGYYSFSDKAYKGGRETLCLWTSSSRSGTEAHHLYFSPKAEGEVYLSNKNFAQSCRCLANLMD